ncbi:1-acylglycerol-3-phosphate O-acyltransferase PNPLA3 [Suricata suricatta]|uniref:Acylglycerol transacylase n=1 Tax=Suricata suricatta TaxID=37032 RepID=A0A673UU57_SURSU|nr:1-acylglycerol-3-phosphate O-acyltransferase PNPLA3 [Suricata suricatta]
MFDPRRGWSLSFSGCGFLGFYHVGVTCCLSERAPHVLRDARMFFGASSGALHGVAFLCGLQLDTIIHVLADLIYSARSHSIGTLHPSFRVVEFLREHLHRQLPADAHRLISGRICISLTRVSDGKNVLVSDFQSKDEVVDALVCSCFIPFYCGLIPPSFRGVRYVDGGLSDNIPFFDAKTTITVSPFSGEYDICPKAKSMNFLYMNLTQFSVHFCSENVYLLVRALFPPDLKVLGDLCHQGYLDTIRFLEENGVCSAPLPGLNLPPGESESESLESPPRVAARGTKTEGDAPLDHVHLSLLPWDKSVLTTLSPKLTKVLSKEIKRQQRFTDKICNCLPVKVLSFVMLPCTLPVESAIALVRRLVRWLPDVPEDILWLQWATVQMCSRVMTCLFPTSRPQIPASSQQPSPRDSRACPASWLPGGDLHTRGQPQRGQAEAAQQSHPPVRPGVL